MPVMTPDDLQAFLAKEFPQAASAGMKIEHLDDRTIRLRLPVSERDLRPGGTVSGPTLMWFADCGFYLLILAQLGPVALAVTTNLNINFMRKPEVVDLIGEGRLLKLGKSLAVGDFTLYSEGKKEPVAHCTLTYSIPPKSKV
ncbi:MAG: PaaI family thioesterase [Alphaproteobacteria bacterium]|nr:PaaI family thioesterase [Alphaproteobacteria bacterium]